MPRWFRGVTAGGLGIAAAVGLLLALVPLAPVAPSRVRGASAFAAPAFRSQWETGEAIAPNFWGPLTLASEGVREPYGGTERLVQYFDKGRMELTGGAVTNGLLATELITGRVQTGDAASEPRPAARIAVAGDAGNAGPTYADLATLTAPATQANGPVTRSLGASGMPGTFAAGANYPDATLRAFDAATGHNVPAAFAAYRERVGVPGVGLAITEPVWTNIRVGGVARDVLVQAFERRVLTYTPDNPEAFRVEFGNIGAHYLRWRYPDGPPAAAPAAPNTASPAATMLMGDAARGQMRHGMLGCASCHGANARGGIGPRSSGTRLTFEEMREVVRSGRMFGRAYDANEASDQDLADIYAWLLTRPAG